MKPFSVSTQGRTDSYWSAWHTIGLLLIVSSVILTGLLVSLELRFWTWIAVLVLLALFVVVAGHGVTGFWYGVLIDSRHKLLQTRLQMVLWTLVILSGFLTAALTNIQTGRVEPLKIHIPPELWLLMGISTTSLVGTPLILDSKKPTTNGGEVEANHQQSATSQTTANIHWADLFRVEDGNQHSGFDLNKLQMLFFTLVLVVAYGAALAALFAEDANKIEALPTLDPGMMLLLGISHVGYLAEKALPTNGRRREPSS